MNVALWVAQGLLAAAFVMAGVLKTTRSREQLMEAGLAWVEDFTLPQVRTIGALELLGGIGVVLPGIIDVAPDVVGYAAGGLALTMLGALATHAKRRDPAAAFIPGLVLLALAVFVAAGRLGFEQL
ncbi:MAG: DoxX family protein [Thermoleophilia bacterium]|nr:DoxX family protein [Thermoleophilia bacterium]